MGGPQTLWKKMARARGIARVTSIPVRSAWSHRSARRGITTGVRDRTVRLAAARADETGDCQNNPNLLHDQVRTVGGGRAVPIKSFLCADTGDVEVIMDVSELSEHDDLELHWAVKGPSGSQWSLAPESVRPELTRDFGDGKALRVGPSEEGGSTKFRFVVPKSASEEEGVTGIVGILVSGDEWLHGEDGLGDLEAPVMAPDPKANAVMDRATEEEGKEGGIGLFRRYQLAGELLPEARRGPALAGALLSWLRLSSNRQLRWYSSGNYQGKDMASLQRAFAEGVCACVSDSEIDLLSRHLFRLAMATLPRGGGNGDDIRMGILNILRTHGIREGHRPGIDDAFLAQWHQKLHSSTTADDIKICEAYLHFLHTGNWDDFWAHLWHNGGLSREDLGDMRVGWRNESGITGPGNHMPQMIPDFQHFLWILKVTHSGADLDTAFEMAKGKVHSDLEWELSDLLQNRDAWWAPGKIVEIREKLQWQWKEPGCPRDVLLLDLSLESFLRTKIEQTDLWSLSDDDVCSIAELVMRSGCISAEDPGLANALRLWQRAMAEEVRWSESWAKAVDSALDYMSITLGRFMDSLVQATQPAADSIGRAAGVPESYLTNFGEEVVRGHPLFALSRVIDRLRQAIRAVMGGSEWDVISLPAGGEVKGRITVVSLAEVQGKELGNPPRVIFSNELGGLEDIPGGVEAILTGSTVDILSHIAIRARSQGVLLASCSDAGKWEATRDALSEGTAVKVRQDAMAGSLVLQEVPEAELCAPRAGGQAAIPELELRRPTGHEAWVLSPDKCDRSSVGGKSFNLGTLRRVCEDLPGVITPHSVSLPFGSFERALAANGEEAVERLSGALARVAGAEGSPETVREELEAAREVVMRLDIPSDLSSALCSVELGQATGRDVVEGELWHAVKRVWASKWTERAYLSRKALGIPDADLSMAVLLMDLVPADYAFVLHTANPVTGNESEVFGEIVLGLGEALVGNEPGRALTFAYDKTSGSVEILRLPSKPVVYLAPDPPGVIARSDSNGEDLEGFAGAGLYDSVATSGSVARTADYSAEPLVWDHGFQKELCERLARVGLDVEAECGAPQDIEGCLSGGEVYLLQSRNQVLPPQVVKQNV